MGRREGCCFGGEGNALSHAESPEFRKEITVRDLKQGENVAQGSFGNLFPPKNDRGN